ncbi:chitobiosyldiphosphodolichol beta-1,4 mannosyltransferase KNAG_0B01470 [Huiozyma naganishii CBS 8797]|uniref:Chitobiosyldiphosphodolichol beta-mannosyltransferase n=1 Tax=Huiozyma naganishii (strain ATCC MYA-139 / BCRC 22969 / CBS 8797 / KCTC 17520 / NBRC 10181 / NCYC 3082 / Yp74L-3) TaxID=1071383 RepID=J7R1B8_HUIN7|nr:hypothetical protein KNAG_0B01470 [Kazachstania naganishii CBS 8797]CCK68595.1 hypothetical protein KNAG_0B01470 [Kazachstania naganishii CBS 8797]
MSLFSWVPNWLLWLLIVYISLPLALYVVFPYVFYGERSTKKRIIIYVLGDLGHSPRICYHASSFSESNFEVELCGYVDNKLPESISEDPNITVHSLGRCTKGGMIGKVLGQVFGIVKHLWALRGSDYILVQNPPSIPILPIVVVYRYLFRCKLIIDWHNLAYSILRLKYSGNNWHPLVLISIAIEFLFAHGANYHLTVTKAMKQFLSDKFWIPEKNCVVFYDRPAVQFRPFELSDGVSGKSRNEAIHSEPFIKDLIPQDFDLEKGDKIIVTSTSFTPDEDISILLGALKIYESSYKKFDSSLPRILCFITGKGPLKDHFIGEVAKNKKLWNRVHIEFVWLSSEDYPKLLRLCDFGVSLHTSSSGLDLPMKILDMFGSGIPVIALNYPVLDELVKHDVNGLKFMDRRELHEALIFATKDRKILTALKEGARRESENRWNSSWKASMKELRLIHK